MSNYLTTVVSKFMAAVGLGFLLATLGCASPQKSNPISSSPPLIRYDFAKGELSKLCHQAIENTRTKLAAIASLPKAQRSFDNTMLAFEKVTADFTDETTPLVFMGSVSPNPETSAEGSACDQEVSQFGVEISTRKDLYLALKDQKGRNPDEKRLLSETLKNFEANGLKLEDSQLAQVKALKTTLAGLESQFSANLNNDSTSIEVSKEELVGVPADYVSGLKKAPNRKFIVNTRESDYEAILANATDSLTRKKWLTAYWNHEGETNRPLLEKAILLRAQIAKLLGYSSWADYRTHDRMAKNGKTVLKFLNSLKSKLAARDREDIAQLLKFKKEIDPRATRVEAWDIFYLGQQLKKRDYQLDEEKIKEYFPASLVVSGMFEVYSKLLGVHYIEVKNASVWSPDVKLYQIIDSKDNRLIGYFYTDFVPRDHKYGHAAAFPLITGRVLQNGNYSLPISAIVANLAAPMQGSLRCFLTMMLSTIFHEFGHIMHQTLTRAPYASQAGSSVAQDFVEAPSQMLENWPWDAKILGQLSGHYLDPSKKLPSDLLSKMIKVRDFNQGYFYTRQLMLALLDMSFHTASIAASQSINTDVVYDQLYRDMIGVEPIPGTHFASGFGHLMGGYDAGYYGYLWSEVYAEDMFTQFNQAGLLNPVVGAKYRSVILENGNMRDAQDLLYEFLGRKPNNRAFFKKLHIR